MSTSENESLDELSFARLVGERLRQIRQQKKLSLSEVESATHQEFKASVMGAYERGERMISVPRLERLANFYGVTVDQLLPRDKQREGDTQSQSVQNAGTPVAHDSGATPGLQWQSNYCSRTRH